MEEESNKKRKTETGIDIDWSILDSQEDGEPPSLVVTKSAGKKPQSAVENGGDNRTNIEFGDKPQSVMENGDSIGANYKRMSDSKIEEHIARQKLMLETMANKLPDGGQKLRDKIKILEEEKDRREINRQMSEDDGRSEMPPQSQSSSGKGISIDFRQVVPPSSRPQSQFVALFGRKIEENANRTTDASENQLNALGRSNRRKGRPNCQFPANEKCRGGGLTSRQTAFQSPTFLSVDGEKQNGPNGGVRSSPSSSDIEEDPFGCSLRRNPSKVKPLNNLRPRNVPTVVVVDEEDYQHVDNANEEEKMEESMKEIKIYYPSRDDPESVEICYADMECLAPEQYLSSTIMNFYIRYLQQPKLTADDGCSYHFFTTYFYDKLKEAVQNKTNDMEQLFAKLRRWWKGVNIFEKAYIFLPINENHHWSLVIICIPDKEDESGPILLHLDSLGFHCSKSIFENIKRFLKKEWTYLKENETFSNYPIADRIWNQLPRRIDERVIQVPQQKNEYDCGLFVLFFIRRFIEDTPQRPRKKDLAKIGKRGKQWFNPKEASDLRLRIRALLKEMFMKESEDREAQRSISLSPGPDSS